MAIDHIEVPNDARWTIRGLTLETLEALLTTLREEGVLYVELLSGPETVPPLSQLCLETLAQAGIKNMRGF